MNAQSLRQDREPKEGRPMPPQNAYARCILEPNRKDGQQSKDIPFSRENL